MLAATSTHRFEQFSSGYQTENRTSLIAPSSVAGILGSLRTLPERLARITHNRQTVSSQFEQWDATDYIALLSNPAYHNETALTTLLSANFHAFAAEYTRGEIVSTFEMTIDQTLGIMGMNASYQQNLSSMGEHFETKLDSRNKHTNRAELETRNMHRLDDWAVSAPVGSVFVWNSPPGKVSEGYAGYNSHSFIFVYEKTSDSTATLHQLRTWMSLEQHQAFQTYLQELGASSTSNPNIPYAHASHQIIDTIAIILPAQSSTKNASGTIAKLIKKAYETEKSWRIKPNEMPKVPESDYTQFRDFLLSLYLRTVVPVLLTTVPKVADASDPKWIAFCNSQKYMQLVKQLDVAFGVLAYQPLVKWVAAADTERKPSVLERLFASKKPAITELSPDQIASGLLKLYELQLKKIRGEVIDTTAAKEYSSLATTLLATTSRGLSLGQCGLGTFIPTSLARTLSIPSLSGTLPLNPGLVMGLPSKEKSALFAHLSSLQFLPLRLKNGEVWYIKAQHFATYQEYFTQNPDSFDELGRAIGPCGWLLRGDARGDDELVLSQTEFLQLEFLKQSLLEDLLDNPEAGIDTFADFLLEQAASPEEKQTLVAIIEALKRSLKKAVGLQELLFNEFFDTLALAAYPFLIEISKKVSLSGFVLYPEHTASQVVSALRLESPTVQIYPQKP